MNTLNRKQPLPLQLMSNTACAVLLATVFSACGGSSGDGTRTPVDRGSSVPPPTPTCTAQQYAAAWDSLVCPAGMLCIGEVSGTEVANITVLTSGSRPDWSPDGLQLVFERPQFPSGSGRGNVYRINVDGTGEVQLADGRDPAWSPDATATRIAYRNADGIAVMNADGSDVVTLIRHDFNFPPGGDVREPGWSPDGEQIVFVGRDWGSGSPQLYVMSSDGNDPRPLAGSADAIGVRDPAWSPDGGSIAFIRGDRALATVDAAGSNLEEIVPNIGTGGLRPDWSPDGSTISYSAVQGCLSREIFTAAHLDGPAKRLLAGSIQAAWSPDGARIAFASTAETYPAANRSAVIYDRENLDRHGSRSRYVLNDNGTFELQYSYLQWGLSIWLGSYWRESDRYHFEFISDTNPVWAATGLLNDSGMFVTYNSSAARDGFDDGAYVLSESQQ